jgi:hypothetical protein
MTVARKVEEALSDLRRALVADGYELTVRDLPGGTVSIQIAAGPQACAECLVPKDVMLEILRASLNGLPEVGPLELLYPREFSPMNGKDHA